MGWLRDLMNASEPRVRSFGALAVSAQKSSFWPADISFSGRSFETLLSRLDRGQDLSWLAERAPVQRALAHALSTPLDAIRRALAQHSQAIPNQRALRLQDLPTGRPLDLSTEDLPPGIPLLMQQPTGQPCWWVAPSGWGKSLLGRWLEARGRASLFTQASAESLGPTFLELPLAPAALPTARPGLHVAAPFAPPDDSGFQVVRSPALSELLPGLVDWAFSRLSRETRLEPEAALEFLREKAELGWLDSPAGAIGLLGLADEIGLRELAKRPLDRSAQRFVEQRIARVVDASEPFAGWLRRSAYAALLGLAERCLIDADAGLEQARSFEEWTELVPAELERHVDLEWMRLSLGQIGSGIRPVDVERAARRLPPGAFRLLTALEQAGILRRDANDRLKFGPNWLCTALRQTAVNALVSRSPFEWGEALLRPHAAAEMAGAVLDRALAEGSTLFESVLDLEAEDQPAYAAAVDVAQRAAGISLLLGSELSQEVLLGLWRENARLCVTLGDGVPLPRIELSRELSENTGTRFRRGGALLSSGSYFLAALRVSEELEAHAENALSALDPFRQTKPAPALVVAYDAIAEALRSEPPWKRAAQGLISRVRAAVGNVLDAEVPHPLELPAQILDEVQHGVLSYDSLARAEAEADWLPALLSLADARGVARGDVARAIWVAWEEAQRPSGASYLAPDSVENAWFWSHVPGTLLENWLVDARGRHVPYSVFGDEQWEAFARGLARAPALVGETEAWRVMPSDYVTRLLQWPLEWERAEPAVRVLWQRFPELLHGTLERLLSLGVRAETSALTTLLTTAPREVSTKLELNWDNPATKSFAPPVLAALRGLWRRLVAERAPDWRAAYSNLARLERELRGT